MRNARDMEAARRRSAGPPAGLGEVDSAVPGSEDRLAEEVRADDLVVDRGLPHVAVPGHAGLVEADAASGDEAVDRDDLLGPEVGRVAVGVGDLVGGRLRERAPIARAVGVEDAHGIGLSEDRGPGRHALGDLPGAEHAGGGGRARTDHDETCECERDAFDRAASASVQVAVRGVGERVTNVLEGCPVSIVGHGEGLLLLGGESPCRCPTGRAGGGACTWPVAMAFSPAVHSLSPDASSRR